MQSLNVTPNLVWHGVLDGCNFFLSNNFSTLNITATHNTSVKRQGHYYLKTLNFYTSHSKVNNQIWWLMMTQGQLYTLAASDHVTAAVFHTISMLLPHGIRPLQEITYASFVPCSLREEVNWLKYPRQSSILNNHKLLTF